MYVREQLDQLVKDGILEESDGSWASPICLVQKKSAEIRICADMRKLNACTRLPAFPIPRIDDTLHRCVSLIFIVLRAGHEFSLSPGDD